MTFDAPQYATATVLDPSHIRDRSGSEKPEMWVQEAVFGHRFLQEQKPFMMVLEALSVMRGRVRADNPLPMFRTLGSGEEHERVLGSQLHQVHLRHLLFELDLDEAETRYAGRGPEGLACWLREAGESLPVSGSAGAYDYLTERAGDAREVLQAVRVLRGLELDPGSGRRHSSRFLAPLGGALHLADIRYKNGSATSDRRFFGRGGEIVYLMLARAARPEDALEAEIRTRFLSDDAPLARLAARLGPDEIGDMSGRRIGYLPTRHLPCYDALAEDWLRVLSLPSLPTAQCIQPLGALTALSVVRMFVEVAVHRFGLPDLAIPLDCTDGRQADLFRASRVMLGEHRDGVRRAVTSYVDETLKASSTWRDALAQHRAADGLSSVVSENARKAVADALHLKDLIGGKRSPEAWRKLALDRVLDRGRNDPADVIQPLGKQAGFVLARRRKGTWFGATDAMLEALVLANVTEVTTLDDFLARLHKRYGIVIGPREGTQRLGGLNVGGPAWRANLNALEARLTKLGLTRRLSDDCTFVTNPFAATGAEARA